MPSLQFMPSCAMALCMLVAVQAGAEADSARQPLKVAEYLEDSHATMRDFGRCAVLHEHLTQMLKSQGVDARAETLQAAARGAHSIAALGTIFGSNDRGENQSAAERAQAEKRRVATNKASLKSILESEAVRQRKFAERGEVDTELMGFCARLNPTQKLMVEEFQAMGVIGP
jgi:hypothetical protein